MFRLFSKIGKHVVINGKKCLNMATMDFLNMIDRPEIEVQFAMKVLTNAEYLII